MEDKIEELENRVRKLENDRKISGILLGLLIVAVLFLYFWGN